MSKDAIHGTCRGVRKLSLTIACFCPCIQRNRRKNFFFFLFVVVAADIPIKKVKDFAHERATLPETSSQSLVHFSLLFARETFLLRIYKTTKMEVAVSAKKKGIYLLSQDLLSLLTCSFLNPIESIMFSQTNKQFHNCSLIRKGTITTFKRNLQRILRRYGYATLDSVLEKGIGVLSGSVVLQAILGEEWGGSDIDLYTTFEGSAELSNKLTELGYFQFLTSGDTDDYIFNPIYGDTNFQGSKLSSLSEWGCKKTNGVTAGHGNAPPLRHTKDLQMLVLDESVPTAEEAIIDFDWDIVMNTWDGTTLHVTAPIAVATRVANAVENGYEVLIKKYKKIDDCTSVTCFAYRKMLRRMAKYSDRGFKIMVGTDEWTKERLEKHHRVCTGYILS